jgi:hypothetical protein
LKLKPNFIFLKKRERESILINKHRPLKDQQFLCGTLLDVGCIYGREWKEKITVFWAVTSHRLANRH